MQGLVFQAYAQFVRYRVGQNLNDESLVSAIAKVSSGESVPAAKDNDAFESAYFDGIAEAVANKLGDLDEDAPVEEKKQRATIVNDTMDKYRSTERYAAILDAAVEAGKVVAPKRERKTRGKKAKSSTAVEL